MGAPQTAIRSPTHGVDTLPRTFSQLGLKIAIAREFPALSLDADWPMVVMYVLLLFSIVSIPFLLVTVC